MLKLREERIKHGYTLKQIGSMVGVSEASVSLYETGKREPGNDTLTFLADLYGVSVDYLLGRDDAVQHSAEPPVTHQLGTGNRPETQAIAAQVFAQALNSGVSKEETLSFFQSFSQLTPEERKTIMSNMKFLHSQHDEEEGT